jgi:NAD(P)-binding Rossmann-like domain
MSPRNLGYADQIVAAHWVIQPHRPFVSCLCPNEINGKAMVSGKSKHVAIIGAGIAGLAVAHRLGQSGPRVTLFEKGRGVGGRMATRGISELQFDHGAQYFTVKGDRFRAMAKQWKAAGHADDWFDGAFVGLPAMAAPARALAAGHASADATSRGSSTKIVAGRCTPSMGRGDTRQWLFRCDHSRRAGTTGHAACCVSRRVSAGARNGSLRTVLGTDTGIL